MEATPAIVYKKKGSLPIIGVKKLWYGRIVSNFKIILPVWVLEVSLIDWMGNCMCRGGWNESVSTRDSLPKLTEYYYNII